MTTATLPKSEWGPGPWQDEPDLSRWVDRPTGLRCAILRSEVTGALGGYVEIDHPDLCLPADQLGMFVIHGGITWSGLLFEEEGETGWWIGFDCWHVLDRSPKLDAVLRALGHKGKFDMLIDALDCEGILRKTYHDIAYVRAEVARLARQVRLASRRAGG